MNKIKSLLIIVSSVIMVAVFISCSSMKNDGLYYNGVNDGGYIMEGETYQEISEIPFMETKNETKSFFLMDSNTASYANLRRYINTNQRISGNIIKTDELINYFSYDLEEPAVGEAFSVKAELGKAPWNEDHHLLTIGLASKVTELSENVLNNIVFLIDVSGSMNTYNKLQLIKSSFKLFIEELNPEDRVSIVTYASGVKEVISCKVSEKESLIKAVNNLKAGGGTSGGRGLELAYKVCNRNLISGGNNRVIICSDGDFNIGISSETELQEYISGKLESGIYLSALGFGMGNYRDSMMETLARHGNGVYAYIDDIKEAKKVLVDDLKTTLITVAEDVKAQVEFNADIVESYRLIGYENKQLSEEEFNDETTDAGEIGSGHTTMVVYELVLKEQVETNDQEVFYVQINYKEPETKENLTIAKHFKTTDFSDEVSEDFQFVACLVEFSLILRDSKYKGNANLKEMRARLIELPSINNDEYRLEFSRLVQNVIVSQLIY